MPEILHGFSAGLPHFDGGAVPGDDGNFYGVMERGGQEEGLFFRVTPGGVVTVLAEFGDTLELPVGDPKSAARGQRPIGPLVFDGAGKFYGVTRYGGRHDRGTLFRVAETGVVETLVDFSGIDGASPGANPDAVLTLGSDGNFYGTTRNGGADDHDYGSIFRLSPQGRFEQLAVFTGASGALPGDNPDSRLVLRPDGSLVGTTEHGGKYGRGTIFEVDPSGHTLRSTSFGPKTSIGTLECRQHFGTLACTPDGRVFGFLYDENSKPYIWVLSVTGASVFVGLDTDGNGDPIYDIAGGLGLTSGEDLLFAANYDNSTYGGLYVVAAATGAITKLGSYPAGPGRVTYDYADFPILPDGAGGYLGSHFGILYRATAGGVITDLARPVPDGGTNLGISPAAPLVFAADGTAIGYCREGGANDNGTLFKLPSTGSLSVLAAIPGRVGFDYNNHFPELVLDASGNVLFPGQTASGAGGILKADPSGIVSEAATFAYSPPNDFAQNPYGALTPDGAGGFYGEAQPPGDSQASPFSGTVFHLSSGNVLSHVGDIPKAVGGPYYTEPDGHLTLEGSGNLLGIFGAGQDANTAGYIFRLTPGGVFTHVIDFPNPPNAVGSYKPLGPLVREGAANTFIFPATGAETGSGDVGDKLLRLTATGSLQTVLAFDVAVPQSSPLSDIGGLVAPVVRAADGTLYGITQSGGETNDGLIYRLRPDGTFTALYSFLPDSGMNPGYPHNTSDAHATSLVLAPDGMLYGTTNQGGPGGGGAIFRFATVPQATGTTLAATNITAHSVTIGGTLVDNGYSGFTQFIGGLDGEPDFDPGDGDPFEGFTGTQSFSIVADQLKGHRDYHFRFRAVVGTGADAIITDGATLNFSTPNGAPQPQDDTIIVTAAAGDFPGQVIANDVDLDDDTLTIQAIATPAMYGDVTVAADGKSLVYHPHAEFLTAKQDSFTYTVTDNYAPNPLTGSATVHVLLDATVTGEYAGLLVEVPESSGIPRSAAAISAADRLAAGLARMSLSAGRSYTARFAVGGRNIAVKGGLLADRDTPIRGDRGRLTGSVRALPAGTQGIITLNGRTLTFIAGQGYISGLVPIQRPISGFTMRFTPNEEEDPIVGAGLPAGSGFATVRRDKKAHAILVGVLPDGTTFSQSSVINADDVFPLSAPLYRDKSGMLSGKLVLSGAPSGEIDNAANTLTHWMKAERGSDRRFADGFSTTLTAFGGVYKMPASNHPPLMAAAGSTLTATFDRGGLFMPLSTPFTFTGAKAVPGPVAADGARATLRFDSRTGLISGSFHSRDKFKDVVKYQGVVVQRDATCSGYFLGRADTGRVELAF